MLSLPSVERPLFNNNVLSTFLVCRPTDVGLLAVIANNIITINKVENYLAAFGAVTQPASLLLWREGR